MSKTSPDSTESTPRFTVGDLFKRLRTGNSGLIPILVGLAALVAYFDIRSHVFLSAANVTNLFIQATVFILLGMAEIWLLLLGEIDLSIGFVAGIGASTAVILVDNKYHWPVLVVLPLALAVTTLIGILHGTLVIRLRLPSFVVTLAGQLGWAGVLIFLIDHQGTGGVVSLHEKVLADLVNGNLTPMWTWIVSVGAVLLAAIFMIRGQAKRRAAGLESTPMAIVALKIGSLVIAALVLVLIFNTDRATFIVLHGMPFAIPIDIFILLAGSFILNKTKAGRYIYAIGGNSEAVRRAGVNVNRYRLLAFALAGFTAGIAGLLYASRLGGISDGIDGGTLVLYAVAAAVIGGTSLFGGRGKMIHAVIGGVIIATIYNGMALIGMSAATQYIATALVLLAAVTIDSVARRGNGTTR
jgi:D-xylose transport system permease protein